MLPTLNLLRIDDGMKTSLESKLFLLLSFSKRETAGEKRPQVILSDVDCSAVYAIKLMIAHA